MRAVGIIVHGGPEALEVVELPEVHAGPGQVRVRIHAAAVNPTDTMARNGSRAEQQKVDPPPYVPGMDAAGIVDEVGPGVTTGVKVGDAVMVSSAKTRSVYDFSVIDQPNRPWTLSISTNELTLDMTCTSP
jgi:NADPH:quinone reductase-like Zn-dependent oxidoreductase